eukprot:scaffold12534_cov157-Isochrysis_galbana.AAC.3
MHLEALELLALARGIKGRVITFGERSERAKKPALALKSEARSRRYGQQTALPTATAAHGCGPFQAASDTRWHHYHYLIKPAPGRTARHAALPLASLCIVHWTPAHTLTITPTHGWRHPTHHSEYTSRCACADCAQRRCPAASPCGSPHYIASPAKACSPGGSPALDYN